MVLVAGEGSSGEMTPEGVGSFSPNELNEIPFGMRVEITFNKCDC